MENIKQGLIEAMADFLDSKEVRTEEALLEICDPVDRVSSELHERMAKAAFFEYEKTVEELNNG